MYHAACKVEFQPFKRSYSQLTFFNFFLKVSTIQTVVLTADVFQLLFFGKLTKSGLPGWFLNKIGYLFFATGRAYARLQNASKTRSGA